MKKTIIALALLAATSSASASELLVSISSPSQELGCEMIDKKSNTIGKMSIAYRMKDGLNAEMTGLNIYSKPLEMNQSNLNEFNKIKFNENNLLGQIDRSKASYYYTGFDNVKQDGFKQVSTDFLLLDSDLNMYGTGVGYLQAMVEVTTYDEKSGKKEVVLPYTSITCGYTPTPEAIQTAFAKVANNAYKLASNKYSVMLIESEQARKDAETKLELQIELITKLTNAVANGSVEIEELKSEIDRLNYTINELTTHADFMTQIINELNIKLKSLAANTTTNQDQNDVLLAENNRLSQTLDWFQVENASKATMILNLKQKLAAQIALNRAENNEVEVEVENTVITECGSPKQGFEERCEAVHPMNTGSMGLGLSIIGLIGLARRKMK